MFVCHISHHVINMSSHHISPTTTPYGILGINRISFYVFLFQSISVYFQLSWAKSESSACFHSTEVAGRWDLIIEYPEWCIHKGRHDIRAVAIVVGLSIRV